MVNKLKSRKCWDTRWLALCGAALGIVFGIFEQFCHAFCPASWQYDPGTDLFGHVLLEVVVSAVAGAALFAGISVIRNWLVKER